MDEKTENKAVIASQNDRFREALTDFKKHMICMGQGIFGKTVFTPMVAELYDQKRQAILTKIANTSAFDPENDPYGEHDFGSVTLFDQTYFWKIDLYDQNFQYGSEQRDDLTKTRRVLTIMHSSEY
ncbi:MAG: DUF3768 domain-containing protein [Pseudomonadota bacterium]